MLQFNMFPEPFKKCDLLIYARNITMKKATEGELPKIDMLKTKELFR